MSHSSGVNCPRCGAAVSESAPEGLCPKCVMGVLLEEPIPEETEHARASSSEDRGAIPLDLDRFGEYRILGEVARGGMGIVCRAEHIHLRRTVALKIISSTTNLVAKAQQRFQAEAETIATLDHPNIVPIYESGQVDGRPFYTMKYIDGEDLGTQLQAGGWRNEEHAPDIKAADSTVAHPPSEMRGAEGKISLLIAIVARAVHHAHQRGVLHRDLKPSNILIDREGRPYVTDFGLAKRMDSDLAVTLSAEVLGTPAYMAPEQARGDGRQLTTAADVYSLGAILFHMLAGEPPFQGTPIQILRKAIDQEPLSPAVVDPHVDPDLAAICLKCLEKNPRRRYASALDLAQDLECWLRIEPIVARPVGRAEHLRKWIVRHPGWATAIGVGTLAAISLMTLLGVSRQQFKSLAEEAKRSAEQQRVLREQAEAVQGRLSKHLLRLRVRAAEKAFDRGETGSGFARLAELVRENPTHQALIRRLIGAISVQEVAQARERLSVGGKVALIEGSGDGRLLGVALEDGRVEVWDRRAREMIGPPLPHETRVSSLVFGPDAKLLATTTAFSEGRQKVHLWDVATGMPAMEAVSSCTGPVAFLSEPKRLVFSEEAKRLNNLGGESVTLALRVFNLEASPPVEIPFDHSRMDVIDSTVQALAVHPSGDVLVATTLWGVVHIFNPDTRLRLFKRLRTSMVASRIVFEPNGKRFLLAGDRAEALVGSLESGRVVDRLPDPEEVSDVDWSADGRVIATAALDGRVRLWSRKSGFRLTGELRTGGPMKIMRFMGAGSRLLTVSDNGRAKVWNTETQQPVLAGIRWKEDFLADSEGQWAASSLDGTIDFWDLAPSEKPQQRFRVLEHDFQKIRRIVFSPDGRVFLTITGSDSIRGWHTETGVRAFPPSSPTRFIKSVDVALDGERFVVGGDGLFVRVPGVAVMNVGPSTPNGVVFCQFINDDRQILSVGAKGAVRLFNTDDRKPVSPGPGDLDRPVTGCDLDRRQEHLLTYGPNGAAAVRDWASGTDRARLQTGWTEDVIEGRFSPDGRYVCLVSENGRSVVLDWRRGTSIREGFLQSVNVASARFSPDGSRLLVLTSEGSVYIASIDEPNPEPISLIGSDFVSARFGPKGRWVVTAGRDWTARVWDVVTGLPIWEAFRHSSPLYVAAISPSGNRLITGAFANAYHWRLPRFALSSPTPDWLPRFAEAVAGRRLVSEERMEPTPLTEIDRIFKEVRNRPRSNFYAAWAGWVLDGGEPPWAGDWDANAGLPSSSSK